MKTLMSILFFSMSIFAALLPYDTTVRLNVESIYILHFNTTFNYHLTTTLSCPEYWYKGDFNFYRVASGSIRTIVKVRGDSLPLVSGSVCCFPPEITCQPDSVVYNNNNIVYAFVFQYDTIYFRVLSMDSRLYAVLRFYSPRTAVLASNRTAIKNRTDNRTAIPPLAGKGFLVNGRKIDRFKDKRIILWLEDICERNCQE